MLNLGVKRRRQALWYFPSGRSALYHGESCALHYNLFLRSWALGRLTVLGFYSVPQYLDIRCILTSLGFSFLICKMGTSAAWLLEGWWLNTVGMRGSAAWHIGSTLALDLWYCDRQLEIYTVFIPILGTELPEFSNTELTVAFEICTKPFNHTWVYVHGWLWEKYLRMGVGYRKPTIIRLECWKFQFHSQLWERERGAGGWVSLMANDLIYHVWWK